MRLALCGAAGSGKCLTETNVSVKPDGSFLPTFKIKDSILSLNNDYKLEQVPISNIIDQGNQLVFKVRLWSGKELILTKNHPLLTFLGWQPLSNLHPGDKIATCRFVPIEGTCDISDSEIIVLGLLLAEGGLSSNKSGISFSNNDMIIVQVFEKHWKIFAETLGYNNASIKLLKYSTCCYMLRIGGRDLVTFELPNKLKGWLKELDQLGRYSYDKYIPDKIFTCTNIQIAKLIGAMWSGDGYIGYKDNQKTLEYSTVSLRMCKQLQHLLLRFGIISKQGKGWIKYKGEKRPAYSIYITGKNDIMSFYRHIGEHLIGVKKQRLQILVDKLLSKKSNPNIDSIPAEVKQLVLSELKNTSFLRKQLTKVTCKVSCDSGWSRNQVNKVGEFLQSSLLLNLANSDVFWESIISIEEVGYRPTFDLQVDSYHNFVTEDTIVHNSTIINKLHEHYALKDLPVIESIVRKTGSYNRDEKDPVRIRQRQSDYNRRYIWTHWINQEFISARSIYDTMAYSKINVDHRLHYWLFHWAVKNIKYDYLFYLPIEFEAPDDGVRPVDKDYNIEFDKTLVNILKHYQVKYHTLTGNVTQRMDQLYSIVEM